MKKRLVCENLQEFVNVNKDVLNESFNSNNLRGITNWIKSNSSDKSMSFMRGGLFYNPHKSLKADQLTDQNTILLDNANDVVAFIEEKSDEGLECGVIVANQYRVTPLLSREFLSWYKNGDFNNEKRIDKFLVFFKDGNVDDAIYNKPKPNNRYKWNGPKTYFGDQWEEEFIERKRYNNASADSKKYLDDEAKKYKPHLDKQWGNEKDRIDYIYKQDRK